MPTRQVNSYLDLQFDKILVDVPCTGDGAARKIPTRFTQFTCKEAFSLFPIQQSCLMKAIQMTKKNGLILYSTCSLSPIENEAVVLDTLRKAKDNTLELIDVHQLLPNFKSRKGLLYWKVLFSKIVPQQLNNKSQEEIDNLTYNDFFEEIENFEDLAKKEVKSSKRSPYKLLREGMWPEKDQEKMKNFGLQKTMRVLPQDQNTGGFYVALFRKKEDIVFDENCISEKHQNTENKTNDEKIILSVDDKIGGKTMLDRIKENDTNLFKKLKEQQTILNSEPYKKVHHEETDIQENQINEEKEIENEQEQEKEKEIQENDKQKQSKKDKLFYEYYRQISEEDYQYLKEFYGLQNLDRQQLITNHEGQEKDKCNKIKLISKKLSEILIQNPENQQTLNLINTGIKVFQRDPKFGLRVSQDGIHHIQKYITKRIYETEFENIAQILGKQRFIYDNIQNEDFKKFLQSQEKGNIIFKTKPVENAEFEYFSVNILEFSIQAMVANIDCKKFQLIYPEIFEKFNSKNDNQILEEQKQDQAQKNEEKV
ncbi:hypothetical protein PPERSA_03862 [Pseudocohnilembus persalinus]|uniref:SAM-dependent MTase RsmB/NOP-type domain-containing protein n=1 Tax=Pseudocohnilembus persalinus TaxID=266149 RepID=A0A0V0Q9J1_PSEPJ|nr:hypothetical protein PPERSA_03862 [Pseudocohnilembus persalinus]|eukprot:KRW98727.1 hypothetical protein PPERSA_03862 [Pseudocohnilembus persalinus]